MHKSQIDFEVLINNKPVTEYTKDGLYFIEGRKNSEFQLRIQNRSNSRILAIPSIDGLSILNGQKANYNSPGYIIPAFSTEIIEGWRINLNTVRKFCFSNRDNSYSNKTGQGIDNLGVIGIACFHEKNKPNYLSFPYINNIYYPYPTDYSLYNEKYGTLIGGVSTSNTVYKSPPQQMFNTSYSSKESYTEQSNLGTGMGHSVENKVTTSTFEKLSNSPFVVMEFHYYEKKQLERMGIIHKVIKNMPSSFPGQFCKEV
jgi:hypothetical protein